LTKEKQKNTPSSEMQCIERLRGEQHLACGEIFINGTNDFRNGVDNFPVG